MRGTVGAALTLVQSSLDDLAGGVAHKSRLGEAMQVIRDALATQVDAEYQRGMCECGHHGGSHAYTIGYCGATAGDGPVSKTGRCKCKSFRAVQPSTVADRRNHG